jgi:hypothetical protein
VAAALEVVDQAGDRTRAQAGELGQRSGGQRAVALMAISTVQRFMIMSWDLPGPVATVSEILVMWLASAAHLHDRQDRTGAARMGVGQGFLHERRPSC